MRPENSKETEDIANLNNRLSAIANASKPKLPPKAKQYMQRSDARRAAFIQAIIEYSNGTEVSCIIKDISASGARISTNGDAGLPKRFLLRIPIQRRAIIAEQVWRRANTIGLRFNCEISHRVYPAQRRA